MMKNILKTTCLIAAMISPTALLAEPVKIDQVEAIVNKNVIMQSDVNSLISAVKLNYKDSGQALPPLATLKKQVIEKLILNSLQLQMAEQLGMKVSESQLEQTVVNIAKGKNQSLEQLKAELEGRGESYAEFRANVREELIISEVRRIQVRRRINISDQEVDALLVQINSQGQQETQYRIGHIMFSLSGDATSEQINSANAKAERVISELKSGSDFSSLALAESEGPKALQGGDWGWMNINEMPTLFAEAVAGHKRGKIIGPFKSGSGLHVLKIQDLKGQESVMTTEVNARHILVKPSIILSDEKAKSLLDKYRRQIINGEAEFADLAKAHSEDPGSAVKGGELGWADPGIYVPAFKSEVERLSMRDISEPFRSTHGWHIVQLIGKRTTDVTEQANKQKAYQILFNRRFNEEAQTWLNELREEAYIKILDKDV